MYIESGYTRIYTHTVLGTPGIVDKYKLTQRYVEDGDLYHPVIPPLPDLP